MLRGELTLEKSIELVKKDRIVYPVVQNGQLIKIFDYHSEAWQYCKSLGTPEKGPKGGQYGYTLDAEHYAIAYNISHQKCPRFVKFRLGYIEQLDLFLDIPFKE